MTQRIIVEEIWDGHDTPFDRNQSMVKDPYTPSALAQAITSASPPFESDAMKRLPQSKDAPLLTIALVGPRKSGTKLHCLRPIILQLIVGCQTCSTYSAAVEPACNSPS